MADISGNEGMVRRFPNREQLSVACYVIVVAWLEVIVLIGLFVGQMVTKLSTLNDAFAIVVGALIVTSAIYFVLAFRLRCPNCSRRFLLEDFKTKHQDADRVLGLAHWASSVIRVLGRKRFACMYCGTRYDVH